MFCSFSLSQMLLSPAGSALQALRVVICSGELLPWHLCRAVLKCAPALQMFNLYGAAEVSGRVA
jgi:hypothetical protein